MTCNRELKTIQLMIEQDRIIIQNWMPVEELSAYAEPLKLQVWDEERKTPIEPKIDGELVQLDNGEFAFMPLFPLNKSTKYLLSLTDENNEFQQVFSLPETHQEKPIDIKIYPTSDSLPENLLRLYIHFSQPMKTIGNLEKIKLIDENGDEVQGAIFNNVYELWNDAQKQLTIILDPARVKTGLQANESLGPALQSGKSFKLVVANMENIHGQKMLQAYIKQFFVINQDTIAPNIDQWVLKLPTIKSRSPLWIQFPGMIDQSSLYSRIKVMDVNEQVISGQIEIADNETEWRFIPSNDWNSGNYTLLINARLEDPSGNNLNGRFDHKIGELKYDREGELIRIPFELEE